jgi:hypothetical protein
MTSSRNVMDAAMRFVDFSRAIVGRLKEDVKKSRQRKGR